MPYRKENGMTDCEMSEEALARLSADLKEFVVRSMRELPDRYREVLVMRCYEEMEYSQIAEELGCTEFAARVLFFRAKKKLAKIMENMDNPKKSFWSRFKLW